MLERIEKAQFDNFYDLLCLSFPDSERRSYSGQLALFDEEPYNVYAYMDEDEFVGALAVWEFENIVYLEHFAVNPNRRNGGIGTKLLGELKKISGKRMCLEVELPENDLAKRRISFYERNGFTNNDYSYMQPPMGPGKKPIPLSVMTNDGGISEDEFEEIRNTLYKYVYKTQI